MHGARSAWERCKSNQHSMRSWGTGGERQNQSTCDRLHVLWDESHHRQTEVQATNCAALLYMCVCVYIYIYIGAKMWEFSLKTWTKSMLIYACCRPSVCETVEALPRLLTLVGWQKSALCCANYTSTCDGEKKKGVPVLCELRLNVTNAK